MKKIILLITLAMLFLVQFSGCGTIDKDGTVGNNNNDTIDNNDDAVDNDDQTETPSDNVEDALYTFEAEVIDSADTLLVTPAEGTNEARSSDKITVSLLEAKVTDINGDKITKEELKPGDIIQITYNGMIAESYPAQITATAVEVIDHNLLIDGYLAIIDDVYQEDSGLNSEITMIALDTTGWVELTEIEKEIIITQMKEIYEMDIIEGTFDELAEQGLIDEENLYFPEGVLIKMNEMAYDDKKETITCKIDKWRGGLGAIGWDATAKYNNEVWVITRDNMWIS